MEPAHLPENAESIDRIRNKLKTVEGRKIYAQRKCTVEPVFGIVKRVLGFRQFFLRGLNVSFLRMDTCVHSMESEKDICPEWLKDVKERSSLEVFFFPNWQQNNA